MASENLLTALSHWHGSFLLIRPYKPSHATRSACATLMLDLRQTPKPMLNPYLPLARNYDDGAGKHGKAQFSSLRARESSIIVLSRLLSPPHFTASLSGAVK